MSVHALTPKGEVLCGEDGHGSPQVADVTCDACQQQIDRARSDLRLASERIRGLGLKPKAEPPPPAHPVCCWCRKVQGVHKWRGKHVICCRCFGIHNERKEVRFDVRKRAPVSTCTHGADR